MKYQLLLLENIRNLGCKGEIVSIKPGFARNYLLPYGRAVPATKSTLKLRERLNEERKKEAEIDKKESLKMKDMIHEKTLSKIVKVDPHSGKMYSAISMEDILNLLKSESILIEKKNVMLPGIIKSIGVHIIRLKLKEEVEACFKLEIRPDVIVKKAEKKKDSDEKSKEEPEIDT